MLAALDQRLFLFFHRFAFQNAWLDEFFLFLGDRFYWFIIAAYVFYILQLRKKAAQNEMGRWRSKLRARLLTATFLSTMGLVFLVKKLVLRLRPFEALQLPTLMRHERINESFPSADAALLFLIAFSLLVYLRDLKNGGVFFALAALAVTARVVIGVHYPLDMFGGMLFALLAMLLAARIEKHLLAAKTATDS